MLSLSLTETEVKNKKKIVKTAPVDFRFPMGKQKSTVGMPPVDFCFPNTKLILNESIFIYWWNH